MVALERNPDSSGSFFQKNQLQDIFMIITIVCRQTKRSRRVGSESEIVNGTVFKTVCLVAGVAVIGSAFCVCAAEAGFSYSQNFNSLPTTLDASWTNNSTLPAWYLFNKDSGTVPDIDGSTGGIGTGSFYSFGSSGSGERALGGVGSGGAYFGSPASGAVAGWIALALMNGTGDAISSIMVNYDGEQWRNGGNTSAQTMVFELGIGATFGSVTWTAPGAAFDFTSPTVGATATALDGNAAANRVAGLGGAISGLSWGDGQTLWLRWTERNDTGNDHGLAIDNFNLSVVPELPTLYNCCWLVGLVGFYGLTSLIAKCRRVAQLPSV